MTSDTPTAVASPRARAERAGGIRRRDAEVLVSDPGEECGDVRARCYEIRLWSGVARRRRARRRAGGLYANALGAQL